MDYVSLFDPIPWTAVGHSVIQTITLYWLVLLGLKIVGRRVFGEMGPQDLIVLLIVSEACDLGLTQEDAGYWGSVFSIITILALGGIIERIPFMRKFFDEEAVYLVRNGRMQKLAMRKYMVDISDLDHTAREFGLNTYRDFKHMMLESDGKITGIPLLKRSIYARKP